MKSPPGKMIRWLYFLLIFSSRAPFSYDESNESTFRLTLYTVNRNLEKCKINFNLISVVDWFQFKFKKNVVVRAK